MRWTASAELNEFNLRGEELPIVALSDLCRALFPLADITDEESYQLRRGQFIARRDYQPQGGGEAAALVSGSGAPHAGSTAPFLRTPKNSDGKPVAAAMCDGQVVALVSPRSGMLKPDLLLG